MATKVFASINPTKLTGRGPALILSDSAVSRLKFLLSKHTDTLKPTVESIPESLGIRLGIKTRGCSGMSFVMNYDTKPKKYDEIVDQDGVIIYIEPKALMHAAGSTMDFVENELTSEFVFHNPKARSVCGCGQSFQT